MSTKSAVQRPPPPLGTVLPQPSSLSNLPQELLKQIASHLDRYSAISLALCSHALFRGAEDAVWASLNLALPPHWGKSPQIWSEAPLPEDRLTGTWDWHEAMDMENARRFELKEKIKRMILRAGERRMGLVKHVRVVQRPVAVLGQLQVLDMVSSTIETLYLDGCPDKAHTTRPFICPSDTLDFHFISFTSSFPSLTYIHIGRNAIHYAEFIPLLCDLAVNLVELRVEPQWYHRVTWYDNYHSSPHHFPPFPSSGRDIDLLRVLRIKSSDENRNSNIAVFSIIERCTELRLLELDSPTISPAHARLLSARIAEMGSLRDFRWSVDPEEFVRFGEFTQRALPDIRRLVLRSDRWQHVLYVPPGLPDLQILCLELPSTPPLTIPTISTSFNSLANAMPPKLAAALRSNSKLHAMHAFRSGDLPADADVFAQLDQVVGSGSITGHVRSYRRNGREVLHLRLLLDHTEHADERHWGRGDHAGMPSLEYTGRNYARRKLFAPHPHAIWVDYTEYNGMVVPLQVLQQMREAEGMNEEDWGRRGVQVGEAAWRALEVWEEMASICDEST